jgi:hypothetical protein
MPKEEDINLDDPNGITQADIDRMNEEADELERIASRAEENSDRIRESKKVLEGMNFAELNILDKTLDDSGSGMGSGESISKDQLAQMVVEIYEKLEEAKTHRDSNTQKISEAEKHRQELEQKVNQARSQISGAYGEINSFRGSPFNFAKGKMMGFIGKLGIYGMIAQFAIQMGEQLYNQIMGEIKGQFKAGGVWDIRKLTEDALSEYNSIQYLIRVRSGQVFFTADAGQDLRQGAPRGANNTRDLRDGHVRFLQFHAGI